MSEATDLLPPLLDSLHNDDAADLKRTYKKKKRDRNNIKMKLPGEDVDAANQTRKRKRTVPSKLKVSTVSDYVPLKRPRGRPPLNSSTNAGSSASLPVSVKVPHKSHVRKPDTASTVVPSSAAVQPSAKSIKLASDSGETEAAKTARPHSALVTQRILSRLMTEGPLSVADLVVAGVDAPPRDLVQSILDVLQVTAVVVQLKAKDPKLLQSSSSGASIAHSSGTMYAMAGVAKGSEYTELSKLSEVTRIKLLNAAAAKKRIEKLQVGQM